ncbi:HNH endonuclease signature motif containing protein [Corynebacterium aquatimens]|uniref:HNH nuclease domain-containing protein n=1 Tax=Corynebacterium aquatimens TaxID=1190508 RepID=A0A931E388_9CORY|nr:HNH endonuclease signature motif containing protein [Corynebacterium aquatimens]MBG6123127.1 hypothetical protein [Corynebacterium aquatimens]WJY66541.1 HNH endonuclease [Corynebacterium aquatimens]
MSTSNDGGGDGTKTGIKDAEAFFSTERFSDEIVASAHILREAEYALFSWAAEDSCLVDDLDLVVVRMQAKTGMAAKRIKKAILAYARLQELPMLRALQEESKLLDLPRLTAIDAELETLGNSVSYGTLSEIDNYLVTEYLVPRFPNQPLPTQRQIRNALRRLISSLDAGRAFDEKKREKREKKKKSEKVNVRFHCSGGIPAMEVTADATSMAMIKAAIEDIARGEKISYGDALVKLCTGEVVPTPRLTLFGFVPMTAPLEQGGEPIEGEAIFFPDSGWTDSAGLATLEDIGGVEIARLIDLDGVSHAELEGYVPSAAMKAYCNARDRYCVWPGCWRQAKDCQLDHRVPFDEGGATTPGNLYTLCQHHHNIKTDRRAFYIADPDSGDVVWLFNDGTYALEHSDGFLKSQLTPRNPRWKKSLADVQEQRRHVADFYAKAHTIADKIEKASDEELADLYLELLSLENEYGLRFEFDVYKPPF